MCKLCNITSVNHSSETISDSDHNIPLSNYYTAMYEIQLY